MKHALGFAMLIASVAFYMWATWRSIGWRVGAQLLLAIVGLFAWGCAIGWALS